MICIVAKFQFRSKTRQLYILKLQNKEVMHMLYFQSISHVYYWKNLIRNYLRPSVSHDLKQKDVSTKYNKYNSTLLQVILFILLAQ